MNIYRLFGFAAALGITVSQWALCLVLFLYADPATAVGSQISNDISQSAIPEIIVIGHRP